MNKEQDSRFWLKVQTRENAKGNYWCNASVKGYDVSVEGSTPRLAREAFREETGLGNNDIMWLPIEHYQGELKPILPHNLIISQKVRLDINPQG